jgi:hypothetical protein
MGMEHANRKAARFMLMKCVLIVHEIFSIDIYYTDRMGVIEPGCFSVK